MGKYDDIINMGRPVSSRHARMSMEERAAQFSPFAALTGYDGVIRETARLTDGMMLLDADRVSELDFRLRYLDGMGPGTEITVEYFRPDEKKEGGAYVTVSGTLKRADLTGGEMILQDGTRIPISSVSAIESPLLPADPENWG